ncbi:MAG TPA: hypothetical protein VFW19_05175 [Allosphingosinicella sp.]|nr:hypothetical protein [Allosphingosinicella sp.]
MRFPLLVCFVLAGFPVGGAARIANGPIPDSLSFEAASWGRTLVQWTVERAGTGRYTTSRKVPSGDSSHYDLVTRSFRISADDYGRLEVLLRPARTYAGKDLPCRHVLEDRVYGVVRWGGEQQLAFNFGCLSKKVVPIYQSFRDADMLVRRLAEAGIVVETKELRSRAP